MKTLVKKHMIGLFALVLTVATMSFKMIEKSNENSSDIWFLMDPSGSYVTTEQTNAPELPCPHTNSPNCARSYSIDQTEIVGGVRQVKPSEVDEYSGFRGKN